VTQKITVTYIVNGSTPDEDEYLCTQARSSVSRKQGPGVVNLRFTDGRDSQGPVDWATYTTAVKVQCRREVKP